MVGNKKAIELKIIPGVYEKPMSINAWLKRSLLSGNTVNCFTNHDERNMETIEKINVAIAE